jgi:chorismate synthase
MNNFGRIFRITIFGESHGQEVGMVIDGCPAGLSLGPDDFMKDLNRRRHGAAGTTSRREEDKPRILSGIFKKKTTGTPILITFSNRNIRAEDYSSFQDIPRPGHADFVAHHKYGGYNDFRGGGHFSGRLTVALVAAGVIAKKILSPAVVRAEILEAGGSPEIDKNVRAAQEEGDSIGGIVECCITGLPPGLGEPFFDSTESLLSHMVFSIPGIKGIEFGAGFKCCRMKGSECNDPLIDADGKTESNHAGGINGGLTNGNDLIFRAAAKPPSSIVREQTTINIKTGKKTALSVKGRHDACIALRMPVILEAAASVVLADLLLIEHKRPRIVR